MLGMFVVGQNDGNGNEVSAGLNKQKTTSGPRLSPARPLTIGGFSSSSSSSGAALSFRSILLTEVVRFRWTSVSNSSSKRTWSTRSGWTGLGSAGGLGVP